MEERTFKELALKYFNESELVDDNFRKITTFEKACGTLGFCYQYQNKIIKLVDRVSKSSSAMFKLNIIRKALNLGYDLHLTKDPKYSSFYYPINPFITESSTYYRDELGSGRMEVLGKIKSKGILYNVLGGRTADNIGYAGLGGFDSQNGVGFAATYIGLLGCATEEIAQHFGKYFGMLITEAKFGDMADLEIIEDKYGNAKNEPK